MAGEKLSPRLQKYLSSLRSSPAQNARDILKRYYTQDTGKISAYEYDPKTRRDTYINIHVSKKDIEILTRTSAVHKRKPHSPKKLAKHKANRERRKREHGQRRSPRRNAAQRRDDKAQREARARREANPQKRKRGR